MTPYPKYIVYTMFIKFHEESYIVFLNRVDIHSVFYCRKNVFDSTQNTISFTCLHAPSFKYIRLHYCAFSCLGDFKHGTMTLLQSKSRNLQAPMIKSQWILLFMSSLNLIVSIIKLIYVRHQKAQLHFEKFTSEIKVIKSINIQRQNDINGLSAQKNLRNLLILD